VIDERFETIRQTYQRRGLKLASVASEESVAAFERKYSIYLPEEYRRFVLEVGNGGDGPPHYGMFPVEESDHDELGRVFDGYAPHLDFPLIDAWVWEDEEDYNEAKVNEVHAKGHIYLGTDGCGMQHVLITSGPEQGNVWMIAGEGAQPVYVESSFSEERRYTFLEWLEAWLDEHIQG
jgi:SMI1 / KNR4 family (SUKH-1)